MGFVYFHPLLNQQSGLTNSMPAFPSYRNPSIDLHSKSIDRFLYEGNSGT